MLDVSREYCQAIESYLPLKWQACQRVPMEVYLLGLSTAAEVSGDGLWGFNVGKQITSAEYGLLGYLVESSDDLQSALEALLQFDKTVADIGQIEFSQTNNVAKLIWHPHINNRQAVLRNMTAWLATVRRVTGLEISPNSVYLQDKFSTQELRTLESWYGCVVQGSQVKNHIEFDVKLLKIPILSRNELVNSHLLLATKEAKQLYENENGSLGHLLPVLHSADLNSLTLTMLADMLNMSTRTLQRRLKLKGLSFSGLLDDERKRRFEQFGTTMSKQMLSELLGYSEQASLNKAVHRWFAMTPSEYGRKLT